MHKKADTYNAKTASRHRYSKIFSLPPELGPTHKFSSFWLGISDFWPWFLQFQLNIDIFQIHEYWLITSILKKTVINDILEYIRYREIFLIGYLIKEIRNLSWFPLSFCNTSKSFRTRNRALETLAFVSACSTVPQLLLFFCTYAHVPLLYGNIGSVSFCEVIFVNAASHWLSNLVTKHCRGLFLT